MSLTSALIRPKVATIHSARYTSVAGGQGEHERGMLKSWKWCAPSYCASCLLSTGRRLRVTEHDGVVVRWRPTTEWGCP